MNLYWIWQTENRGYDTYDSAVVVAETEDQARLTHPGPPLTCATTWDSWAWVKPEQVQVMLIGRAVEGMEAGVVVASFNAG